MSEMMYLKGDSIDTIKQFTSTTTPYNHQKQHRLVKWGRAPHERFP